MKKWFSVSVCGMQSFSRSGLFSPVTQGQGQHLAAAQAGPGLNHNSCTAEAEAWSWRCAFLLLGLVVTCAHPAFWNTVHSRLDMTALPGPSIPSLPWKATAPPQSYRDIPVRDGVTVLGVISWPLLHSLVPPQRFSKCGPWTSSVRLT